MRLFNQDFVHLDEDSIRNLLSIDREHAIYTDTWIDEINDFRHVRIDFTESEVRAYVESLWAYELYLAANSPPSAKTVKGINPEIADRADSYVLQTANGRQLGPPYHCAAGFLGQQLEELVCSPSASRRVILEEQGAAALLTTVKRAMDSLIPSIRLFNNREKGLAPWPVTREDDVRDLIYAMLRASIEDIKMEEPVPSRAGGHKFIDLFSRTARLAIEIKWIGSGQQNRRKSILAEINDDIQSYGRHPDCNKLVFLVVDNATSFQDPSVIQRDLSGAQEIDGKRLHILVFIREP